MTSSNAAEDVRVVFITAPPDEGKNLARQLVEHRLAACINIVPKIESYFWWDDSVQHDEETLLICKTSAAKIPALQEFVNEAVPYDLPEVISFPLTDGLPEYLAWVRKETEGAP